MNFYSRYAQICAERSINPCSQKMADAIGVTRASITTWNQRSTVPNGKTIALIADVLHVSADYLLFRTDDPVDHSDKNTDTAEIATKEDSDKSEPEILALYSRLDASDQLKVEGIIQGLLMNDKYKIAKNLA